MAYNVFKMAKTRPVSFRVDETLYSSIKNLRESFKLSFSELVEKALLFFRYNADEVVEFRIEQAKSKEVVELSKNPGMTLRNLRLLGIETRGQLNWIAAMISEGWGTGSGTATATWVASVVKALRILWRQDLRNRKDLIPYLVSTYPNNTSSNSVEEMIDHSMLALAEVNKIDRFYAERVAKCFETVLREGEFSINRDTIIEIRELIEPWYVWVVKRALSQEIPPREIDTLLLMEHQASGMRMVRLPDEPGETTEVSVSVFLPFPRRAGMFQEDRFGCGFEFGSSLRRQYQHGFTTACDGEGLYELIQTITLIEGGKAIAQSGSWELMSNDIENAYTVRNKGNLNVVTKSELGAFMSRAKELYALREIQIHIAGELADKYGAL